MKVSKDDGRVLDDAIAQWQTERLLTQEEASKLKRSYEVAPFDWQRVAKYSFWLAIACIVIAVSAALVDEWLINLILSVFKAPDSVKCIGLSVIAGLLYFIGLKQKSHKPDNIYSNEAIFFLGVIATATAISFLGKSIDIAHTHFALLLLIATVIYGALGLWFPSILVWLFALLSLGGWFGAQTGYLSGWGAYYLGMNYPLRFVFFGLVLAMGGSAVFSYWRARQEFMEPTKVVGLLYLFVALWLMSIFGNYGSIDSWISVNQLALFHWSLLFALAAIVAILYGIKFDDATARGFGLAFIFINLYTRYFEYFWDTTHKAVFFALLGLSFWLIGSKAEKIWRLGGKAGGD